MALSTGTACVAGLAPQSRARAVESAPLVPGSYPLEGDSGVDASSADGVQPEGENRLKAATAVDLPDELLELVMRNLDGFGTRERDVKACSLVCKNWSSPAQRILFGKSLPVYEAEAARRLRSVLQTRADLQVAARTIDLATALEQYTASVYFRRAAALLRDAPFVQNLTFLHVGLSDKTRSRFYSALRSLPVELLTSYSSHWPPLRGNGAVDDLADVRELLRLLCDYRNLKSLSLSGFSSYPGRLDTAAVPAHTFPTYQLRELHVYSCNLADSSLFWLLGNSRLTLRKLDLGSCYGLTAETLSAVLTLVETFVEDLTLAMDLEDLSTPSGARPLETRILHGMSRLRRVHISTDRIFPPSVLLDLVLLPRIEDISLAFPLFEFGEVKEAADALPPGNTLRKLYLDAWETPNLWSDAERWYVDRAFERKGVEVLLNGLSPEDVERAWYGEDLSEVWHLLERDEPVCELSGDLAQVGTQI